MKTSLITGINGQDGSYLAELLLQKDYLVHGIVRRTSTPNLENIKHLLDHDRLILHYGDLSDDSSLFKILRTSRPDEIYNLAAQSHVGISFDNPVYTSDINALGPMRILECMKTLNMFETSRFYQASTSELYGKVKEPFQSEKTPFNPRSPYAIAKHHAFMIVRNYCEAYGLFGCNGILFNHESPRRGLNFVTRKITKQVGEIYRGERNLIEIGNLNAERDWGHAKDYVEAMHLMLQHDKPDDYVVSMGEKHSVREFVEICFKKINIPITWSGSGLNEVGKNGKDVLIKINPEFYRPTEVDYLIGNSSKIRTTLKWKPKYSFEDLVSEMMNSDLER
jgi:GDPmannose 4,6-dehydratase